MTKEFQLGLFWYLNTSSSINWWLNGLNHTLICNIIQFLIRIRNCDITYITKNRKEGKWKTKNQNKTLWIVILRNYVQILEFRMVFHINTYLIHQKYVLVSNKRIQKTPSSESLSYHPYHIIRKSKISTWLHHLHDRPVRSPLRPMTRYEKHLIRFGWQWWKRNTSNL